ncbi:MAG TPA: hypothetical protein VEU98_03240, partial [Candidatus Eremiobacteraceae bacterium]|nr:hypothetical protein [Candidatus Eremiobacteraceae bacterium]
QNLPDTAIARWSPTNAATGIEVSQSNEAAVTQGRGTIGAIAPANVTLRWLPHSKFDHEAHTGFTCVSCHAKATTSTESSDVLIPGIATCKTCHAPGPDHTESRCFECHTYHDWSQRKDAKPAFTLPALKTGM